MSEASESKIIVWHFVYKSLLGNELTCHTRVFLATPDVARKFVLPLWVHKEYIQDMEQLKLNLKEAKSASLKIRVQPSLLAIFEQRCSEVETGPVDVSDQLRRLMVEWIKGGAQRKL